MKNTELRIGNLICSNVTDVVFKVGKISKNKVNGHLTFDEVQPIPLTAEWLVGFGFEKMINPNGTPSWIYVKNGDAWIYETFKDHDFFIRSHFFSRMVRSICFVHTLQNLYFALTGEELTLKEEVKP